MDVGRLVPYASIVTNGSTGRLYVVATPIGNLGDMSERARETLASCTLIAAEDTRRTGLLLKAFGLVKPMWSLHEHNETQRAGQLIEKMRGGAAVALVSDAGTPGINDPGFDTVRACAAQGIEVIAVPGPCALIAALSVAGLPTDRFCFEGFLPARRAPRLARLAEVALESRTLVFYEAPHRVGEMLEDCVERLGGGRPAAVARELTKLHETLYRGPLVELAARAAAEPEFARGEIVLVVAGASPAVLAEAGADGHGGALDRVLAPLLEELPLRQAAHLAARIAAVRENEAYKRALVLKQAYGAR